MSSGVWDSAPSANVGKARSNRSIEGYGPTAAMGRSWRRARGVCDRCCAASEVRFDEDFLMRAMARGLSLAVRVARVEKSLRVEAAGVGGVYGESVLPVGSEAAAGALVWGLKTIVFAFHRRVCL
ncbi:hypothetical protein, partial [Yoonia sp. R2-816]|uniref:hypothetical protein n=1 Tax=Yoonia sp. R2-816 TaxID=3342638 RepID=UPI00372D4B98